MVDAAPKGGALMDEWIEIATRFHDTYERLAPEFGYKTREEKGTGNGE